MNVMRPGCTYAFRKSLVDVFSQADIQDSAHDAMLWRIAIVKDKLALYEKPLIKYRRHSGNATTSKVALDKKERIAQLDWLILNTEHFLRTYWNDIPDNNRALMEKDIQLLKQRIKILMDGSIISLMGFQFRNRTHYSTTKNMLSELLIQLKGR